MEYTPEHGRTDAERRFLARLAQLQPPYYDVWNDRAELVVAVSIMDTDKNTVIRTLRVDFDGAAIVAGNDPTHQLSDDLDPDDPDRFVSGLDASPDDLADKAMAWFRKQAERPIERREWEQDDRHWVCWVLADVDRRLVCSSTGGPAYVAGLPWAFDPPHRPPDRIVTLPNFSTRDIDD